MQSAVFTFGPLETNCYVIHTGSDAIVVDPGGPPAAVLSFLAKSALNLTHIFLTHLHFDHTCGAHELALATGAPIYASAHDRFMLSDEMGQGGVWGLPLVQPYNFLPLEEGELSVARGICTVLATPGHSPGGLSLYFVELQAVFAGDTLFYHSIGRTDLAGGNLSVLQTSIRARLFSLPDNTLVYPGHGPATCIGDEKRNNPYIGDFCTTQGRG